MYQLLLIFFSLEITQIDYAGSEQNKSNLTNNDRLR